jgi:pimeloyl-ACP methyl ester carboxylesterase
VAYSRPGYPGSDRDPGRRVADCAGDVSAIADVLGIDSFFTIGLSCGGPYALASAALLPGRIRAAATVGSNAPRQANGIEWHAGMGAENLEEFGAAESGSDVLREYLTKEATKWRSATIDDVPTLFGDRLSDDDARLRLTQEQKEGSVESIQKAVATGIWGWFDDDMASIGAWGFDLSSIKAPVSIWHGGEDDKFIPSAHGEWLAENVPGATLHLRPEEDHLSISDKFGEVLDHLLMAR